MTGCPYRKGKFGHRQAHKENTMKTGVNAATSQGMPKIVSKPLEPRRQAWNRFSLTASEGPLLLTP